LQSAIVNISIDARFNVLRSKTLNDLVSTILKDPHSTILSALNGMLAQQR